MGKTKLILVILIALIVGVPSPGEAQSPGWHLSVKRLWLAESQGLWAQLQYQHPQGQSLYWESLQIGDLYHQQGMGFGTTLFNQSPIHLYLTMGIDEYQLMETENNFYRTGLVLDLGLPKGRLTLSGHLGMDDLVGFFPRYQLNYALPVYSGEIELGGGNLLGSQEGWALWMGIGF